MNRPAPKLVLPRPAASGRAAAITLGSLVALDTLGRPLVQLPSDPPGPPTVARCAALAPQGWDQPATWPLPVLLWLEDGDPQRPVITGFVSAMPVTAQTLLDMPLPAGAVTGLSADGKRLCLQASDEVVLQCGKGSITLTANGRVVIKGTELVSRATASNKIRGATVSIN